MSASRRIAAGLRAGLRWPLLLSLLLYAMVAPGMMPQRDAGGFSVVICTGEGPLTVTLGPDGAPVEPGHAPCDWLLHMQLAVEAAPPVLTLAATSLAGPPDWPAPTLSHARAPRRADPIRGPPTLL